jgi:hypothetical protein
MAHKFILDGEDVVFTSLFGKYERLNELKIDKNPNTRYICFTDDSDLTSRSWEIYLITPKPNLSPQRNSREIKMLGHRYFNDGTRSLYIDNTVSLKVDGKIILDYWLSGGDIAFMTHSTRKTVRSEFFWCSAYGLDKQSTILKQFRFYKNFSRTLLNEKPYWGGMIARVNCESTEKFMKTWNTQFRLFSCRDQLSINISSIMSKTYINRIFAKNDSSEWHTWPIHSERTTKYQFKEKFTLLRKLLILNRIFLFGHSYYF